MSMCFDCSNSCLLRNLQIFFDLLTDHCAQMSSIEKIKAILPGHLKDKYQDNKRICQKREACMIKIECQIAVHLICRVVERINTCIF